MCIIGCLVHGGRCRKTSTQSGSSQINTSCIEFGLKWWQSKWNASSDSEFEQYRSEFSLVLNEQKLYHSTPLINHLDLCYVAQWWLPDQIRSVNCEACLTSRKHPDELCQWHVRIVCDMIKLCKTHSSRTIFEMGPCHSSGFSMMVSAPPPVYLLGAYGSTYLYRIQQDAVPHLAIRRLAEPTVNGLVVVILRPGQALDRNPFDRKLHHSKLSKNDVLIVRSTAHDLMKAVHAAVHAYYFHALSQALGWSSVIAHDGSYRRWYRRVAQPVMTLEHEPVEELVIDEQAVPMDLNSVPVEETIVVVEEQNEIVVIEDEPVEEEIVLVEEQTVPMDLSMRQ